MKAQVSLVKCSNYDPALVSQAVKQAVDLLGGLNKFIRPGESVLVKPNLLMAKEPEYGIDTHPEVVRAVVKMLKNINCRVLIGDGPTVWGGQAEDVDNVYEKSGIKLVAQEEGAELVKFEKKRWRGRFPLTSWLDECDCFINIPKLKTHEFTLITGAIKNLFGLVPGNYKTELHKQHFYPEDFSKMLVDIYLKAKPRLTIIDGILAMEGDGPATSGKPRDLNLLLAGEDCLALDFVVAKIIGVDPLAVLTNKEGVSRRLSISGFEDIEILGEKIEALSLRPFLLPAASALRKVPPALVKIARKLIRFYPCVEKDNCVKCAACLQACPNQAIKMCEKGPSFCYSRCIACFCCEEACPASAIKIKKSFLAKLLRM
ncbi:MAG: DUF362 domain-containing protein [Candidatus Omnitrophica bacterium]|nr:DUF362 domain-containing protein [Candidatus Omnitrophota bacterium]